MLSGFLFAQYSMTDTPYTVFLGVSVPLKPPETQDGENCQRLWHLGLIDSNDRVVRLVVGIPQALSGYEA